MQPLPEQHIAKAATTTVTALSKLYRSTAPIWICRAFVSLVITTSSLMAPRRSSKYFLSMVSTCSARVGLFCGRPVPHSRGKNSSHTQHRTYCPGCLMKFWLYLVVCEYPYKQKKPFEKGISPLSKGKLANKNLFGRFYYPFIKKRHLFIRMKPVFSILHNSKRCTCLTCKFRYGFPRSQIIICTI